MALKKKKKYIIFLCVCVGWRLKIESCKKEKICDDDDD